MIFLILFSQKLPRDKKIVHNFGKFLKNTCERIHFSNFAGVLPKTLLKIDCFTYIFKGCT